MAARISAYVPFFNNAATIEAAVVSLQRQTVPVEEVFVVDDGSTDGSADLCQRLGVTVLRHERNRGRGAARATAMHCARGDFVLCCDATNALAPKFAEDALAWFKEPSVAGVFGIITDPTPKGAVGKWRARHLFKGDVAHSVSHHASLITFGALLRSSAVSAVGGFRPELTHSEDVDLGQRLLSARYDVISDPSLKVYAMAHDNLGRVLERYWRWHTGKDEEISFRGYWRGIRASAGMAADDFRRSDAGVAAISLLCPHFQFGRTAWRRIQRKVPRLGHDARRHDTGKPCG